LPANNANIRERSGEIAMIARHWRGWTKPQNADAYETLLKTQVLPGLKKIAGYRGGYVLRGDAGDEVEFVVINLFDSVEAVRAFAGPDYTIAIFEPEARLLLSRIETTAHHYEVRASTASPFSG
jgi:antibiotic biosynthesis monooxygenase (ABM) superfamily enzyme